ncbi:MAG: hypothetical protein JXR62_03210 [Bacilli bacterium]|nr:hypothetical protein [Bacilli bacterium]
MLDNLPFIDTLQNFFNIDTYLQQAYDFIIALSYVEKLVGVLLAGIIVVLGVFELVKKLSKLIIVVAILAGLWVLYNQGIFDGLIG